jgi:hypothetical protein
LQISTAKKSEIAKNLHIEANTLGLQQVSDAINSKIVIGTRKDIKKTKNSEFPQNSKKS